MAKIIKKAPSPKVAKQVVCRSCGATIEYVPNDLGKPYVVQDYGGGSDSYADFSCPNCHKKIQVSAY